MKSESVKLLSCIQLFATLWTVARQAPQSMEFSRQEYWSGYMYMYGWIPSLFTWNYQQCCKLAIPQYKRKNKRKKEYWNRLLFPRPGDLPNPGIEPTFPYVSCFVRQVLYHQHHLDLYVSYDGLISSFSDSFPISGLSLTQVFVKLSWDYSHQKSQQDHRRASKRKSETCRDVTGVSRREIWVACSCLFRDAQLTIASGLLPLVLIDLRKGSWPLEYFQARFMRHQWIKDISGSGIIWSG